MARGAGPGLGDSNPILPGTGPSRQHQPGSHTPVTADLTRSCRLSELSVLPAGRAGPSTALTTPLLECRPGNWQLTQTDNLQQSQPTRNTSLVFYMNSYLGVEEDLKRIEFSKNENRNFCLFTIFEFMYLVHTNSYADKDEDICYK